jgi:hypothetical protein
VADARDICPTAVKLSAVKGYINAITVPCNVAVCDRQRAHCRIIPVVVVERVALNAFEIVISFINTAAAYLEAIVGYF